MDYDVPGDLAEKAAIMREFGRRRAAGEPVSEELQAQHVNATNDNYATGPLPGERIPEFSLPDANGIPAVPPGSDRVQWLAPGISPQRGLVTILPIPTGRVGTIPLQPGAAWCSDRCREL